MPQENLLSDEDVLVDAAEERAALGWLILDTHHRGAVDLLRDDDFGLSSHRQILSAIRGLIHRGCWPLDYNEICGELRRRDQLENCGGVAYISNLGDGVVIARTIPRRVTVLRSLYHRRVIAKTGEELQRRASDLSKDERESARWGMTALEVIR